MTELTNNQLGSNRLETRLKDKKPSYTPSEAVAEASRCIYCSDAPCVQACPTGIDIPTFIHKIATGNDRGAARTIFEENLLGYSCARVCPVEVLCVGSCVYNQWGRDPIQIGRLQRHATETALAKDPELLSKKRKPATGKKIALLGAGPASLAAAGHLALDGHSCVIFEKRALGGGLNTTGVAPYKLHVPDSLAEIDFIQKLGDVTIKTGVSVVPENAGDGQVSVAELEKDYDAVFIGIGLGADSALGIEGEDADGVYGATALIERIKTDNSFSLGDAKDAVIVGAGNTAIDIAHELALLGLENVTMVYRRDEQAMSGYAHEMEWARKDSVRLLENRQPVGFTTEGGRVTGVQVCKTENGRNVGDVCETLRADIVAVAVGQARLTKLAEAFGGVKLDGKGRVQVDESTCQTGNPRVYAGGDCVNGGKEVVNAAQHGKLAAAAITKSFAEGN